MHSCIILDMLFFVLVRGKQPGIYSQWKEVVDLMINYPDPYVKGFYTFHEAIEYARHEIGPNYHVSKLINTLNSTSASSSRQSNKPVDNASVASASSLSIQFCDHCEAMTRAIKNLNETKYYLDSAVTSCSQKITALESVNIKLTCTWLVIPAVQTDLVSILVDHQNIRRWFPAYIQSISQKTL